MIWKGLNSSSIAPVNGTGCSRGSSSKLHLHERININTQEGMFGRLFKGNNTCIAV